jgi:hypothetical protein
MARRDLVLAIARSTVGRADVGVAAGPDDAAAAERRSRGPGAMLEENVRVFL